MTKQRNALKAGTFIMISVALAFVISVAIKGTLVESMQTRIVGFALTDDLGGLRKGDDVRIGGFKVGEVRSIEVVTGNDQRLHAATAASTAPAPSEMILVTLAMPKRYELHTGARIGIQSTVTGQSCLNFD